MMLRTAATTAAAALFLAAGSAAADPGDVLWRFDIPDTGATFRPSIAADGTIYWPARSLYAVSPAGQMIWSRPGCDGNPVGIGQDGTLYVGGTRPPPNDHLPAVKAFSPTGDHLWDYTDMGLVVGFLGGPNVGPDGNIYIVAYGGANPGATGFGAFSLTPAGALRWHVDGFGNDAGTPASEIVFGDGRVYKAEYNAPMPAGQLQSGIIAFEVDGDISWRHSIGTPSNGPGRHPCVSPLNGKIHMVRPTRTLTTFRPDGSTAWVYTAPYTPTGLGVPAVGPDGTVFVISGDRDVIALDAGGGVRWTASNAVPNFATAPEVSPDGTLLVFGTNACFGAACPGRIIALDTATGAVEFDEALPAVPGNVATPITRPRFSRDGSVVYLAARAFSGGTGTHLFAIETGGGSSPCFANCDASTAAPVLNVADFTCFLQEFAAGEPYANCDGSTAPPVLNVADFTCFLQRFAAGCP